MAPAGATADLELPKTWTKLRHVPEQQRYLRSEARIECIAATRRGGKSEIVVRKKTKRALTDPIKYGIVDWLTLFTAPTRRQAKVIYWEKLKRMVPRALVRHKSEVELTLTLVHGAQIRVDGMDVPERLEGRPIDDFNGDEFGNTKPDLWDQHVLPALWTEGRGVCEEFPDGRPGTATLYGTPEGLNHFKDLCDRASMPKHRDHDFFHWTAFDVLTRTQIEFFQRTMDPLAFEQEFLARFVSFTGRAYYNYERSQHSRYSVRGLYDPRAPLYVCQDFGTHPGVAEIGQFIRKPDWWLLPGLSPTLLGFFGEVYIPRASNSKLVAQTILDRWKGHEGEVILHGDPSGGDPHSSGIAGTDWEIVLRELRPAFGDRVTLKSRYPKPSERGRINAVNSLLRTADGRIFVVVDADECPNLARDLERSKTVEGGSGQLDKKSDKTLTHCTDAIGYLVADLFPSGGSTETSIIDLM